MKMMMSNMNKGEQNPMLDTALDAVHAFGKIYSVFDESYVGGEFCRGLIFSKEASRIAFKIGNSVMNQKKEEDNVNAGKKSAHFKARK